MSQRNRHRFGGAYRESAPPPIDLPFTIANFRTLLTAGMRPDAPYTHQQIKDWAARFWWAQSEQPISLGADVVPDIEQAADLAQEVEVQWDLYLANTYTLSDLQRLDFAQVHLPYTWFAEWLARLHQMLPPSVSE